MEKFGIFNLLNSFLNLSSPSDKDLNTENAAQTSTTSNLLNGLFSGLNDKPEPEKQPTAPPPTPKPSTPLQSQMLKAISTHDEIIKRVNKNNTPKT